MITNNLFEQKNIKRKNSFKSIHEERLIGEIIEKRYVILEIKSKEGSALKILVYDMNSLKRIEMLIEPDADGNFSGKKYSILSRKEKVPTRKQTLQGFPYIKPPLSAVKKSIQSLMNQSKPLTDAPPKVAPSVEPSSKRKRIHTDHLEAAWFARAKSMDENSPIEEADVVILDNACLKRDAEQLSIEDFEKYALHISPPPIPQHQFVDAILEQQINAIQPLPLLGKFSSADVNQSLYPSLGKHYNYTAITRMVFLSIFVGSVLAGMLTFFLF